MIIGIDNGLDGGIVMLDDDGRIVDKRVMPTFKKGKGREVCTLGVEESLHCRDVSLVVIEQASKHAAGVLSLCSTWYSFGLIMGAVRAAHLRHEIIPPQRWQKMFWARPKMAQGQKFDTKAAALQAASRLWPKEDWTKSERATKPNDGMVDAALIAEFGRRAILLPGSTQTNL